MTAGEDRDAHRSVDRRHPRREGRGAGAALRGLHGLLEERDGRFGHPIIDVDRAGAGSRGAGGQGEVEKALVSTLDRVEAEGRARSDRWDDVVSIFPVGVIRETMDEEALHGISVQGLVIGLILGILGYYNAGDAQTVIIKVLQIGMNLAAVMVLLPRMVQILMEGLIPVSEAARDFMQKRASGREIYVGLDSAILIGHPAAISSSLILVPIAILLSIILPGNRVILFADLAVIPFVVAMFAPIMRGNILRMVIGGTITLATGFYVATGMSSFFTNVAASSGFDMPAGAAFITSIADGFMWPPFVFVIASQSAGIIGLVVLLAILAVAMFLYMRNPIPWEVAAGAASSEEA